MRACLGTTTHFCEAVVLKLRTAPIGTGLPSIAERRGNNLKGFKDFYLKAKAIIWPWVLALTVLCVPYSLEQRDFSEFEIEVC